MNIQLRISGQARTFLQEQRDELAAIEELKHTTLQVGNDESYAKYLQDRSGFTVVDGALVDRKVAVALRAQLSSGKTMNRARVRSALAFGTVHAIKEMLAFTGGSRPPVRAGGPTRPAHAVGWGDITTSLAQHYFYRFRENGPMRRFPYEGTRYD